MRIVEITRDRREELYGQLDADFHEAEMELIFSSAQAAGFVGSVGSGAVVAIARAISA